MKIHKEGYPTLTIALILLTAVCFGIWFTLGNSALFVVTIILAILFYSFLLRFFRSPKRKMKQGEEYLISPADGKIVAIEEVEETEFIKERCLQVSIFMSVWNVHINWYPISGVVKYYRYHPGKYLLAWHPKSSSLNERTSIAVERKDGVTVLFRQIAGFLARRVVCYAKENATVTQGTQVGFIKFGSRVDIFIPLNSIVKVELNHKVKGLETIIAVIPSKA